MAAWCNRFMHSPFYCTTLVGYGARRTQLLISLYDHIYGMAAHVFVRAPGPLQRPARHIGWCSAQAKFRQHWLCPIATRSMLTCKQHAAARALLRSHTRWYGDTLVQIFVAKYIVWYCHLRPYSRRHDYYLLINQRRDDLAHAWLPETAPSCIVAILLHLHIASDDANNA